MRKFFSIVGLAFFLGMAWHGMNVFHRYVEHERSVICEKHKAKGDQLMARFNDAGETNDNLDEDISAVEEAIKEYEIAEDCAEVEGKLENARDSMEGLLKAKMTLVADKAKKDFIEPYVKAGQYVSNAVDQRNRKK